jgi:hypothetical protein
VDNIVFKELSIMEGDPVLSMTVPLSSKASILPRMIKIKAVSPQRQPKLVQLPKIQSRSAMSKRSTPLLGHTFVYKYKVRKCDHLTVISVFRYIFNHILKIS